MNRDMKTGSFLGVLSLLSIAPQAFVAVDANLSGHSIKSMQALRKEVVAWRDEYQPNLNDDDCDRLAGWLNRNFYRLSE